MLVKKVKQFQFEIIDLKKIGEINKAFLEALPKTVIDETLENDFVSRCVAHSVAKYVLAQDINYAPVLDGVEIIIPNNVMRTIKHDFPTGIKIMVSKIRYTDQSTKEQKEKSVYSRYDLEINNLR